MIRRDSFFTAEIMAGISKERFMTKIKDEIKLTALNGKYHCNHSFHEDELIAFEKHYKVIKGELEGCGFSVCFKSSFTQTRYLNIEW